MKTTIHVTCSQAYVKPLVMGVFLAGLCLSGIRAQAYFIGDDFAGHTAGTYLNGTMTPTGNATWTAPDGILVFGSGSYLTTLAAYGAGASVNLPSPENDITRVQVEMHPVGSWLGFQLGGSAIIGHLADGIFVLAHPDGYIQVWSNSEYCAEWATLGSAYNFNANVLNTYALEYHQAANTISLWGNGIPLITDQGLTPTRTPGSLGIAGLRTSGTTAGVATYANFEVSGVPEPVTLALLAVGGLVLGGRRRRD